MADEKFLTAAIIHGFAAAHAVTAFALSQTLIGDELALSALTVTMIISISRVNGASWGVGDGLSMVGLMAGFYLGTRGAMMLVKWIPGIGNLANAITTAGVTEILGWSTYLLVREGKTPSELSEDEVKNLRQSAENLKKEMGSKMKEIVARMSHEDKSRFDKLIDELKNRDISEERRKSIDSDIEELISKYNY